MSNRRPRPRSDRGSAFVVALLVLLALTFVGLSLSLNTQAENQLGSNERVINRVFHGADSGISLATGHALVEADYGEQVAELPDPGSGVGGATMVIETTPFAPIQSAPCNLCEINNAGNYGEPEHRRINFAVASTGKRYTGTDTTQPAQGQHRVASMIEIQPMESLIAGQEAAVDRNDPTQAAQGLRDGDIF